MEGYLLFITSDERSCNIIVWFLLTVNQLFNHRLLTIMFSFRRRRRGSATFPTLLFQQVDETWPRINYEQGVHSTYFLAVFYHSSKRVIWPLADSVASNQSVLPHIPIRDYIVRYSALHAQSLYKRIKPAPGQTERICTLTSGWTVRSSC